MRFRAGVPGLVVLLLPGLQAADSTRAERLFAAGSKALEEGRMEDARASLREAAKLEPANPRYALTLGQLYLKLGDPKLAIPQLRKASLAAPADLALRFLLIQAYQAADNDLEALRLLDGSPPPPLLSAWNFTRGFSLFRLGRIDAAEKVFRALLSEPQTEAPANFFLGNCAFARNRFDRAIAYYQTAITQGNVPDNKALNTYYYNYGLALFQLRRFQDAAGAFRQSIERYSTDPLPWLFLGRCEAELKHFPEAIAAYESAARNGPEFRLAYYQLARLHAEHGDPKRAQELFQKVADLRQKELEKEEDLARRLKLGSR